ncbi:glycoside hydrolase domain-containing protein [Curtobacterium sp. MCSS17_016]|uniref:glycoside hydrolase domain-containing protein n=1 Tax=Curtobacterium sp. MCSS17_016 TaxID=2175644 RepID=UPI0015E8A8F7|nr:glycoside hydrolase domain-containing protein [Curtobacterium sp. MCSS17_016]WIE80997.1 DUF1906 domain-containing protein [Curtobacterium sp. MCSS17_016]
MVDTQLQDAQKWLNSTFGKVSGWTKVKEDGYPGQNTVNGIIEGLQTLLGISPVVPAFGPTTVSKLAAHGAIDGTESTDAATNTKWIKLVQAALYAKGYPGSNNNGVWDTNTQNSIRQFEVNLGVALSDNAPITLPPKVFQALLNTDPSVPIEGGKDSIVAGQRWLNNRYGGNANWTYNSTGGVYDRPTQMNLVKAIQIELGQGSGADGLWGPTTASQLRAKTAAVIRVGSTDSSSGAQWVHLFKAAAAFNGFGTGPTSTFTAADSTLVKQFQRFEGFSTADQTGAGEYRTWAEFIVSAGDTSRKGTAVDCASTVTAARGDALRNAGYTLVGRYLTNLEPTAEVPDPIDKVIKPGELQTIFAAGLGVFPIFEEGSGYGWFTSFQGGVDVIRAVNAARKFGFPAGTTIYFAVDFDATDTQIDPDGFTDSPQGVIPYFRAVQKGMLELGSPYAIGIYGTRNVCRRVSNLGFASKSFIAGMSTGWSGNLGFLLPTNWAFNQISTINVGSGSGLINVDNDIASGRDAGVFGLVKSPEPNAAAFDYLDWLQARAKEWNTSHNTGLSDNELLTHYMRIPDFDSSEWTIFAGDINRDFTNWVDTLGVSKQTQLVDPQYRTSVDTAHLFGAAGALIHNGLDNGKLDYPSLSDYVGWAGDLLQVIRDGWQRYGNLYSSATEWAQTYLFSTDPTLRGSSFGMTDLIQDAVAHDLVDRIASGASPTLAGGTREYFENEGRWGERLTKFVQDRFGGSRDNIYRLANQLLTSTDPALIYIRAVFVNSSKWPEPTHLNADDMRQIATVFADKLWDISR